MAERIPRQVPPGRPAARKKGSDNPLTHDYGPLPGWGWAVVAVAGVYLWRKIYQPSPAGATTVTGANSGVPYSYDLYGAGYDAGIGALTAALGSASGAGGTSGAISDTQSQPTPTSGPAPTYTNTAGEELIGSGYGAPGATAANRYGAFGAPIDTAAGSYEYVGSPAQAQAIQASGGKLYYQDQPGDFKQVPASGLASGTPLFSQLGA